MGIGDSRSGEVEFADAVSFPSTATSSTSAPPGKGSPLGSVSEPTSQVVRVEWQLPTNGDDCHVGEEARLGLPWLSASHPTAWSCIGNKSYGKQL